MKEISQKYANFQQFAQSIEINTIGKQGSLWGKNFISFEKQEWKIIRLNFFERVVRFLFKKYQSTHFITLQKNFQDKQVPFTVGKKDKIDIKATISKIQNQLRQFQQPNPEPILLPNPTQNPSPEQDSNSPNPTQNLAPEQNPPIINPPQWVEKFTINRETALSQLAKEDRDVLEQIHPSYTVEEEAGVTTCIDGVHPQSSSHHSQCREKVKEQCQESLKQENSDKNRYSNIMQYDKTRVQLKEIKENYINAGADPLWDNRLIVSQGPLSKTVDDHWQMIWEQNVSHVFCLTKSIESLKVKTESYDIGQFGHMTAQAKGLSLYVRTENGVIEKQTIEDENRLYLYNLANAKKGFIPTKPADFVSWLQQQDADLENLKDLYSNKNLEKNTLGFVVTLDVQKEGEDESRTVKLDHFSAWPDHGVPEGAAKALFADRLEKAYDLLRSGRPTLVHCSAGIGRTGVFWTGLRLMQEAEINLVQGKEPEKNPNIPQTVLEGRMTVRPGLIQTDEQMQFIGLAYQAALPAVKHMVAGEGWKGSTLKNLRQQRRQGT